MKAETFVRTNKEIAPVLKAYMKKKGMTQIPTAKRLGISQGQLSKVLAGRAEQFIPAKTFKRLFRGVGISLS